jgi:hypothetical protein
MFRAKGDKKTYGDHPIDSNNPSNLAIESRDEPSQRQAVGDAMRMRLGLREAMSARETADKPDDTRLFYLRKGVDQVAPRLQEIRGKRRRCERVRRGGRQNE